MQSLKPPNVYSRHLLAMLAAVLAVGCTALNAAPTTEPDPLLFRSESNYVAVILPPGWGAAEGPADLSGGVLMHKPDAVVSFNSWGEAGFWAVAQAEYDADSMTAS